MLVIGGGELKSSAKKIFNKSPLVFEIKITKNWVKIVSTIVSCQNLAKKYLFFILLYSPSLSITLGYQGLKNTVSPEA
jgi:hypothetical protein